MKHMCLWAFVLLWVLAPAAPHAAAQSSPLPESGQAADSATVWKTLWQPAFDASRSASVKDLTLERDRIRITLADGTLQFTQPANGVVFGATFHGNGRLQVSPPNAAEAQQLKLFSGQDGLGLHFTEATFSFTDNTFQEVAPKLSWAAAGGATDALYTSRQ